MSELIVMEYNIRCMTSMFRDGAVKPEYRQRAEAVAGVIRDAHPHLLGIVEAATAAENEYFIREFLPDSGYQLAHGVSRGYENIVFYYRDPLRVVAVDVGIGYYEPWVTDLNDDGIEEIFRWDKKPLEVIFQVGTDGPLLHVILVHAPTKGVVRPVDFFQYQIMAMAKRERLIAEGQRLRARLDRLLTEDAPKPLMVLGDMNDTPTFDSYERALGAGYVELLTGSVYNPELILHNALWWMNCDTMLKKELWTCEYEDPLVKQAFGQLHRVWIDHVLVSPSLQTSPDIRLVPRSGRVGAKSEMARLASDHFPIFCSLEVP